MSDVIDKIREKYPAYKDVSEDELVQRIGQRYPQYLDRDPVFKADFDRITKAATTRVSPPHTEESDYVPEPVKPPEGPGTSLYPIGEGAAIPGSEPKVPEAQAPLIPPGTMPSVTPPTAQQEAAASQRMEKLTAPIVPLPKIEGTNPNVLAFLAGAMGRPVTERESQAIAALYNTGKGFAEFFESPLGISTMGTAGVAPSILKRLVSGLFAADIAKNTPEAARKLGEASVAGTPQEQLEAGLSLATTILLPSALGKHAIGEPIATATGAAPSVEGARVKVPFGAQKDLAMLADRMSAVAPATAAATKSVAELPIPKPSETKTVRASGPGVEPAKEIPTVTETTPKVPEAEMPKTPTETGFRPAIRLVGGEVVVGDAGKTHPDIIAERGLKAEDIDQRGFVNEAGEFKDREQTAQETGLPTQREEQRQHSTDLPEAQPTPVEKGKDAIHGEAAPILRPVREEPEQGVQQVPVEEGRKPDDERRREEAPKPEAPAKQDVAPEGKYSVYPVGEKWLVQSTDKRGFGDTIHETREQAEAYADRIKKVDASNVEFRARQEAALKEQQRIQAEKEGPLKSYLDTLSADPMDVGRLKSTLSKQVSKQSKEKTYTGDRAKVVRDMVDDGYVPKTEAVKAIPDPSRSRWNNMDGRQQDDFLKRQKEAGTKTEYQLEHPDGSFFTVTKAEYDYARWISEKRQKPPTPSTPPQAVQKVEQEIKSVAKTEGQPSAKEVKAKLVASLEKAVADAPPNADFHSITGNPLTESAKKAPRTIKINIPGDGDFDVVNRKENVAEVLAQAKRISTSPQGPTKVPISKTTLDIAQEAEKVEKAYGGPEKAYQSVMRQRDQMRDQEPPRTAEERNELSKRIDEAEYLMRELYGQTKAGSLESQAEAARDRVATYKMGAEGFEKEIARLENLKRQTPAHKERLADLKTRYEQNQMFIRNNEANAEKWEQEAAKEKAKLGVKPEDQGAQPTQGIVGMGGAVKSEFEPSGGTPTSTKNAVTDQERVKRGLPPAMQPARKAFGEVWDRAMAMVDHDPGVQDVLIKELRDHPRAIKDEENALLLHRQIDLQNEYGKATRDLAQAYDDGRTEDVVREKLRVANLSDRLLDLYDINKRVGTETGRGLASRKMMANEDFTLASLELQKRAANGGRALTDTERANLQKIADDWKAKAEAYERVIATKDQRIADMAANAALEKVAREAAPEAKIHPKIIQIAERIVKELDTKADAARARIRERMGRTMAGVDPTVILDLAEIGASHLGHKILDFAKWSDKMIGEFGDWVKPHLKEVYDKSQATIDTLADRAEKAQKGVKRALKGESIEDTKKSVGEAVGELNKKGEKSKITWQVQKLARALYRSGITEREAMVDALHEVLKEAIPDITRRETADAFSGYGDFKQLKKDQMSVDLRGMKGELQQLAKLEDMAAGKPPLKTGVERRTQTEAERKLIKEVNDAKNKFQVPVEDPETQLKSSLDTLKTTLKNRIADLEDRMARKDYAPRPRRELTLDAEAARLKAARDRVSKKWNEELTADRLKNRTPWEKVMDWTTKLRRFDVLSSPVVIPKLLSAGLARITTMPTEDIIGGTLAKIPGVSEVAKRAPLEGAGLNLKAELKGFKPAFMQGLKDSYDVLKTGHSDLDVLYGKAAESYTGEFEYGARLLSFPGRLHGMIKAPVKRIAFERAVDRLKDFYAKEGADLTNDATKMKIGVEAYKAANRSIFLQDNKVASAFTAATRTLESAKRGEAPSVGGKAGATAARVLLPIVRVPTNIVAETFQYIAGTVTGSARMARAFAKGIENIKPEEADLIMRELKKGSLGAAVMLIGYFNPEAIGGYYQPGKKRDPSDVKAGSIRVYGHDIPSYLLHNPLLETLQFGATIRRVSDSYLRKKDTQQQGVTAGVWAATLGLTEEVPFVREMVEYEKLRNPYTRGQFMGDFTRSLVVPAAVQKAAEWTDRDEYGNLIQRKPGTVGESIKSAIPGLRETVPVK